MSGTEMIVDGGDAIAAALAGLGKAEQGAFKKTAKRVTREAMKPLHAAAKGGAPRASGTLAKAVRLRAWRRPAPGEVGMKVYIDFTVAPYGLGIEAGYIIGGRYIPGRHFLRKAADRHGPAAQATLSAALSREADRAIKGKS